MAEFLDNLPALPRIADEDSLYVGPPAYLPFSFLNIFPPEAAARRLHIEALAALRQRVSGKVIFSS